MSDNTETDNPLKSATRAVRPLNDHCLLYIDPDGATRISGRVSRSESLGRGFVLDDPPVRAGVRTIITALPESISPGDCVLYRLDPLDPLSLRFEVDGWAPFEIQLVPLSSIVGVDRTATRMIEVPTFERPGWMAK